MYEIAVDEISTYTRLWMILHKQLCTLLHLWRRGVVYHLTKLVHQFVVFRSLHGHLLKVRGIALEVHALSRLRKDRLLGEVGEHDHEGHGAVARHLIAEASCLHLYGVETVYCAIRAIDVKLALVEVQQSSVNAEMPAVGAAGGADECRHEGKDNCHEGYNRLM